MKRILSNDELIPGNWYWIRSKGCQLLQNGETTSPGNFRPSQVKGFNGGVCGRPKSISDGMWCDPTNDQALGHYEIYGPIELPQLK